MKNTFNGLFFILVIIFCVACNSKSNQDAATNEDPIESNVQSNEDGRYCNDKYSFCINYPQGIFVTEEESESEEGIVLTSEDRLGKLVIHRGNLDSNITEGIRLKEAYNEDLKPRGKREVTYNSFGTTNYVLMGYENKTIFYQKTIIVKGTIVTAVFYYDDKEKDTYYPMIDPIFKSFK